MTRVVAILIAVLLAPALGRAARPLHPRVLARKLARARRNIQHVIVIMQENRSFDNYFGTYPHADGIPMRHGVPTACAPDPERGGCLAPFHDPNDRDIGGPHDVVAAMGDVDGGKMDGFLAMQQLGFLHACTNPNLPVCVLAASSDAMGYHDAREIPNYWAYARNFVLQDRMFEPTASWSLPAHLFLVSGWSASCTVPDDPSSCTNDIGFPPAPSKSYAWTDLTWLLHEHGITWAYYLSNGSQPDCDDDAELCAPQGQNVDVPGIWNPLPRFDTVRDDGQLANIQETSHFLDAARTGTLPAVSWIVPNQTVSEHPPALISDGQRYVTGLINAVMQGPQWNTTAIFVSWDDWGGFYDHVIPPVVDGNGYGLRVPGLVISAWAKRGYVDHQVLSFDAYLKFIEDLFLDGQRLDPANDGRPDPRPDVRENAPELGNLLRDFQFHRRPRRPLVLPTD